MTGRTTHGGGARPSAAFDRLWAAVLREPWTLLVVVALALAVAMVASTGRWLGSWHYVVTGVDVLTGAHPLGLYATHPELQMGPLTFLLSTPLVLLPAPVGLVAATLVMEAAGLLALREVRLLLRAGDVVGDRRWFLGAVAVLVGWNVLAVRYGHPDDAFALLAAVWGLRLLRSGSAVPAAVAIGLSIDCKPWTAPLALVLLAAPRRSWLPAGAALVAVVALAWAPFLLDPGTLRATRFTIAVDPIATIHLLGVADVRTPAWCRPAQLLVGALLVAVVARRNRWAALLVVVVVRLLLDPGAHAYYDAGLLLGACVLDLGAALPIATLVVLLGVHLPPLLLPSMTTVQALLRFAALMTVLLLALLGERRAGAGPAGRLHRPGGGLPVRARVPVAV